MEKPLKQITEIINRVNGNVYLVGGAVRDELMEVEAKDIDFCVTGITSEDFLQIFPDAISTGKDFPVFRVIVQDMEVEFALARQERTSLFSHNKNIEITTNTSLTIEDDLKRRDLTINSIAKNLKTGEYIDPFGGIDDIKNRIIRHTSEAFIEDPLRVYRATRFASTLNFDIAEDTIKLMYTLRNGYHFYKQDINIIKSELDFLQEEGLTAETIENLSTLLKQNLGQELANKETELKTIEEIKGLITSSLNKKENDEINNLATMLIGGLYGLSKDRIRDEFEKALSSQNISNYFLGLKNAGVLDVHFQELANLIGVEQPEYYHPEGDAFTHSLIVAEKVRKKTDDLSIVYAALLHDLGKGVTPIIEYPRHIGHEKTGIDLVRQIGSRLGVKKHWISISETVSKYHMIAARFDEMRAPKKIDFITEIHKSALGLKDFELIINADEMIGRNTAQFANIGEQLMHEVTEREVIKKYTIDPLEIQKNPNEFKEIVRNERIQWFNNYQQKESVEKKQR